MDSQWSGLEVFGLSTRKELYHVLKIKQTIIDGSGGEHKQGLTFRNIIKKPIHGFGFSLPLPNIFPGPFRHKECNVLFVSDQPFDHHQTNICLAKSNAVTEKSSSELSGDLHKGAVAFFLILVKHRIHT